MLYVALGRNIGDTPMELDEWVSFRDEVVELLALSEGLSDPDTVALGESHYGGDPEETWVLVWFDKLSPLSRDTEGRLSYIAVRYGQESIAWSVAETMFVEGVK
jgi:hypothetical protein